MSLGDEEEEDQTLQRKKKQFFSIIFIFFTFIPSIHQPALERENNKFVCSEREEKAKENGDREREKCWFDPFQC